MPNQTTAQSNRYGSYNHSRPKKWSKPEVKIYRSMTFYRSDHKSKTSIAQKATGIKTHSSQPSQPVSQYSDVMVAAQFKYIQSAVGNKPQLNKSGDTTPSRTLGLRVDPLTIVNNDIVSSSADHHHPLSATAPVFTPSASSPSTILAPDTIINVLNTRVNRQVDAIRRATKDGLHPINVVGDGAFAQSALAILDQKIIILLFVQRQETTCVTMRKIMPRLDL